MDGRRFNLGRRGQREEKGSINVYLSSDEFNHFGHIVLPFNHPLSGFFFIENGANEKRDIKFISIHITSMIYKWNHYFLVLVMEMFKTIQKERGIKTLGVFLNDGRRVGFASINLMGNPQCDAFVDLFQLVNKKKILYIFIFITNRFSPFSCLNSFLAFWHSVGLLPPLLLSTLGIVSGGFKKSIEWRILKDPFCCLQQVI